MTPVIDTVLVRSVVVLLLVALTISVANWKKMSAPARFISYFLLWNLIIEIITFLLPPQTNNLPLLHIYTLVEFILFTLVYKKMDLFIKISEKTFWIYLGSGSLIIVLNSLFLQNIFEFNTYAKTSVQIMLIGYAIGYIFLLTEKSPDLGYLNLINAAVLIFYSGSLFIFMFGNIMVADNLTITFWRVNGLLNILFQILIIISLWKASRIRKLQF